MATTYAYVDGTAFTDADRGKGQGAVQLDIMSPILDGTDTVLANKFTVDGEGRVSTLLISAARTTDQTSAALYSRNASGLIATLVVTAIVSSPSITFAIQAYDAASATWVTLLTSAAITGASTNRITVSPQVSTSANVSLNSIIPDTVRIFVDHSNANSITYSVGLEWT